MPYFAGDDIEPEFLASAALTLRMKVYCRSEHIPVDHLCVVERGIAAKAGHLKTKGSCLGEDMILSSDTFKDLLPAIALTFVVQTAVIERRHLDELTDCH